MIYLDYAATTPTDERVVAKMLDYLGKDSCFANPASRSHMLGWQAEAAVESARKQIASVLNCDVREIVWTSGATESNNLAIKGALESLRDNGDQRRHIVTSRLEHKAVLDCFSYIEKHHNYRVSYVSPNEHGLISQKKLEEAVEADTVLVSVMHVNNEVGLRNPIAQLAAFCRSKDIIFHADCAQSAGKELLDMSVIDADMISICAHKIYGPKGIGALFVRRRPGFSLSCQIHGGGHERGMRSGTLPVHQIVAFGEALSIAESEREAESARIAELKKTFLRQLNHDGFRVSGGLEFTVPNILNLAFPGLDGQMVLAALPNLAVSSGSACNSASMAPSHVLKALGVSDEEALSALRFSFGRFTTQSEVEQASSALLKVLVALSP
jgi:cysteine desulfurase